MADSKREPSHRPARSELVQQLQDLKTTVEELRSVVETLEFEREHLLEENRRLRRDVTRSQLVDNLLTVLEDESNGAEPGGDSGSQAGRLHRALPPSFSFQRFFQVAEREGIDTTVARGCLRQFLDRDLLVRNGSRLTKRD